MSSRSRFCCSSLSSSQPPISASWSPRKSGSLRGFLSRWKPSRYLRLFLVGPYRRRVTGYGENLFQERCHSCSCRPRSGPDCDGLLYAVSLAAATRQNIRRHLREYRRRLPSSLQESEWLFASKRTRMPSHPWSAQRRWLIRAGEKVGVGRLGWHAFRHTYSTLLNEHGTDVKVQQELLCHANIRTTTNIYTRAVPERLQKANSKLVRLLLPRGT